MNAHLAAGRYREAVQVARRRLALTRELGIMQVQSCSYEKIYAGSVSIAPDPPPLEPGIKFKLQFTQYWGPGL